MRIEKKLISEEKILELAINSGAEDCMSDDNCHAILTKMQNFYKVKSRRQVFYLYFIKPF